MHLTKKAKEFEKQNELEWSIKFYQRAYDLMSKIATFQKDKNLEKKILRQIEKVKLKINQKYNNNICMLYCIFIFVYIGFILCFININIDDTSEMPRKLMFPIQEEPEQPIIKNKVCYCIVRIQL